MSEKEPIGRLLYEVLERGRRTPKFLVTGGNIGDNVAEALAKKGHRVRVLVRSMRPDPRWNQLGIEQVAADLASVKSLAKAFEGVDRLFSLTPFVENFVRFGENTIEAAEKAGVSYIVRSSFMGASATGITMGQWHRQVEKAVEASGIPYTILQPNTFMQSYLMHAQSIRASNVFYLPQGDGKVSLVDVRDIAAVATACLTEPGHAGKTYVLTGSEALSNAEIARRMSTLLGRRITYCDLTARKAEESMTAARFPGWMIRSLLELFEWCKTGHAEMVSNAVEPLLQRKPLSFDQFLAENSAAFSRDREFARVSG